MARVRVYQLAKDMGLSSADLIKALSELGVGVKAASSTVDEETAQAARELLSSRGLTPGAAGEGATAVEAVQEAEEEIIEPTETITIAPTVTVREFAALLDTDPENVMDALKQQGMAVVVNQILTPDLARKVGELWGYQIVIQEPERPSAARVAEAAAPLVAEPEPPVEEAPPREPELVPPEEAEIVRPVRHRREVPADAPPRPPVVTIMGHVDHGKTTLLDRIRNTSVTEQEAGGITQHIGAYQVSVDGRQITFIDTPGHEAFTAMRARGAQVTDVAVIVVAADDGIMPQTVEAIAHARAAEVPVIVAINKVDLPTANVDRVKQQLAEQGLTPEDWGGETVCVPLSAREGTGVDTLLEMILLVADIADLRALREGPAEGTVIEAEVDRRRGPLATVLVETGTLHVGDSVLAGQAAGRVRAMLEFTGRPLKEAGPATPVQIMGLSAVPEAGDELAVVESERMARQMAEERRLAKREEQARPATRVSLQELFQQIERGEVKDLNIVLKTDVQGTVDAIAKSLQQLRHPEVRVNIVHAGVGDISESDVMLATASNAVVIGFQVGIDSQARTSAHDEAIDARIYQVIYDVIDDVKAAMVGMLEAQLEEAIVGQAEVRALFKSSRAGIIAGCSVPEGRMLRGASVRVRRGGDVVHEGRLDSLRHLKEDVREVMAGFECGIALEGFNGFEVGDIVECYEMREVRRQTL